MWQILKKNTIKKDILIWPDVAIYKQEFYDNYYNYAVITSQILR